MKNPKVGMYVQNSKGVIFKVLPEDLSTIKAFPENYRKSSENEYWNQASRKVKTYNPK